MYEMKYVHSLADIPKEPHYVIIKIGSVFIPGDERSRTNPGHGYPERTEHYPEMRVTTNKAHWEKEIAEEIERDPKQQNFIAYFVPAIAAVTTKVSVDINL